MFSQTAEYALRTVVHLAATHGTPQVTRDIALATKTPEGYLSKVLQTLGRAGIVESQRGLHGGFILVREPADLTVLDVVQAVDPLPRIRSCPLKLKSHGMRLCPLHRELDQAVASVEKALGRCTIDRLLMPQKGQSVALCERS